MRFLLLFLSLVFSFSTPSFSAEPLMSISGTSNIVKYTCPMHPHIIKDGEGPCPICGMDLVTIEINPTETKENPEIKIAGYLKQAMAIRLAPVKRTTLRRIVKTFGQVKVNENNVLHVHPRASGWIEKLNIKENGQKVTKGEVLYELYSPDILAAQEDFVLALSNLKSLGKSALPLVKAAKVRLQLLGLSARTINRIKNNKKVEQSIPIIATQNGIVSKLMVTKGMFIQPTTQMMTISDLSDIWVIGEVLESQQDWVRFNSPSDIHSAAYPTQVFKSKISFIYPEVNPISRALKIRLPLKNIKQTLKLNMPVEVIVYGEPKHQTLTINQEAIIRDGDKTRVIKEVSEGKFQAVDIELGMQTIDKAEVVSGLNEGDSIVVSGQFLIDSESQLRINLLKLISGSSDGDYGAKFDSNHNH